MPVHRHVQLPPYRQELQHPLYLQRNRWLRSSPCRLIDLNESTGIRLCQGDNRKWQEQTKREWDKYTFGCYGCWVMDDDGNLDYVSEDDYTEELWNELSRKREGHLARVGHH